MFMRLTAMALVFVSCLAGWREGLSKSEFALESTIALSSSRDNPILNPFLNGAGEIYLMSPDGTVARGVGLNDGGNEREKEDASMARVADYSIIEDDWVVEAWLQYRER